MFDIELTGTVGGPYFNSRDCSKLLDAAKGKKINVLIDSLGGSLAHALSIADAFRTHGDVHVHMRGFCASAATIAALGAKNVSVAPDAFYLVHKASVEFFEFCSHNADSLENLIKAIEDQKNSLDKIDRHVAKAYAQKCKKPAEMMLAIMKEGKWLTADEALDFGFVDQITASPLDSKPELTAKIANDFIAEGFPLPPLPISDKSLNPILAFIKSLFNMNNQNHQNPDDIHEQTVKNLNQEIENLKKQNLDLKNQIENLNKKPAHNNAQVVDNPQKPGQNNEPQSAASQFMKVHNNAARLFNSLP